MKEKILGIHHVTAIGKNPKKNIDFYTKILGLRLVKMTVNFDDPTAYHLYYGDEIGHPGTILTFFIYPDSEHGKTGNGQAITICFSIPPKAVDFWMNHFEKNKIKCKTSSHFNEQIISFLDYDELKLELVADKDSKSEYAWKKGQIPREHAIRGIHHVTLSEEGYETTAELLSCIGFKLLIQEGNYFRYKAQGDHGTIIDISCAPDSAPGIIGVGCVHHVAFRTPKDKEQKYWHDVLAKYGMNVTPIVDRKYFHSIYFREPGGVLFEIATDPPGFTVDEKLKELGKKLVLPEWCESIREKIEKVLPSIK